MLEQLLDKFKTPIYYYFIALFFCCLTPAEQNYDIGDQELLVVKLALEEWHHWLEGAEHPFIIWTDHKNVTYLRTTERLN